MRGQSMWAHKGVEISIDGGGKFRAHASDIEVVADSLDTIKPLIEKALKSASGLKLKLPVIGVLVEGSGRFRDLEDGKLHAGILEGVNRTTSELTVKNLPKDTTIHMVLPDTPECRKILSEYLESASNTARLKAEVECRQLESSRRYGRVELAQYEQIIRDLRYRHALVSKGEILKETT